MPPTVVRFNRVRFNRVRFNRPVKAGKGCALLKPESNNGEQPKRSVQDRNDEADALTIEIGLLSEDVQALSNMRQKAIDRRKVVEGESEDAWEKMNEDDSSGSNAPASQNDAV